MTSNEFVAFLKGLSVGIPESPTKEQWEIRNGVSELTGTERINRLAILEQEEKLKETLRITS